MNETYFVVGVILSVAFGFFILYLFLTREEQNVPDLLMKSVKLLLNNNDKVIEIIIELVMLYSNKEITGAEKKKQVIRLLKVRVSDGIDWENISRAIDLIVNYMKINKRIP